MRTNDIIFQTVTRVAVFLIVLYSLNLFFAGHYTPGGGFIAGLMTAAAIVLLLLAYDIKTVVKILPINYISMVGIGLLLAVGTSVSAILFGKPFLTHAYDYFQLPLLGKQTLHTAVAFDTGVYLVVVGVTLTIIQTIGESE
ncbi:Na(+)/H(+) antiporter subunit B [Bacillus fonticola]|uniref:Na(+)/H(+) antiporter subunit B n=1 Tax=Bacillus fonticola TaxID=2728853 RepID=UPI0014748134|nr:Na(+)/H(+) antiporter subunit B [Bacillus fonticola]